MNLYTDTLFPGTFSPVHNWHLYMAKAARLKTDSNRTVLIPAFSPYHKANDSTPFADKFEMVKLAAQDTEGLEVSDIEYRMHREKSYTYETVKRLIEEETQTPFDEKIKLPQKIKLLMGTDAFAELASWYKVNKLAQLVEFVVCSRLGYATAEQIAPRLNIPGLSFKPVDLDQAPVSSTRIREMIKLGQDVSQIIPEKVLAYIKRKKLYTSL